MPKVINDTTRKEIKRAYAEIGNQSEVARRFKVSNLFVHYLVNNKPIRRTPAKKSVCPITGF